jgi:hypothetical protein
MTRTCERCGCTDDAPCRRDGVACGWHGDDLCSFCMDDLVADGEDVLEVTEAGVVERGQGCVYCDSRCTRVGGILLCMTPETLP